MMTHFTISGRPVPAARPRFARQGEFVRTYTPKSNTDYAELVRQAWPLGVKPVPKGQPVSLFVTFWMPRPKAHYGTGRNAERLKLPAPHFHVVKPDLDNLVKLLKDALKGLAWSDDSQVTSVQAKKLYGEACTEVTITSPWSP